MVFDGDYDENYEDQWGRSQGDKREAGPEGSERAGTARFDCQRQFIVRDPGLEIITGSEERAERNKQSRINEPESPNITESAEIEAARPRGRAISRHRSFQSILQEALIVGRKRPAREGRFGRDTSLYDKTDAGRVAMVGCAVRSRCIVHGNLKNYCSIYYLYFVEGRRAVRLQGVL